MSLHDHYHARDFYSAKRGMWKPMVGSLLGEDAIWPGGFGFRESEYASMLGVQTNKKSDRIERIVTYLKDARLVQIKYIAQDLNIPREYISVVLNELERKGAARVQEIGGSRFWALV